MEIVSFTCKECDDRIGEFANLWTQVGKSYFSPIVDAEHAPEIESHGPHRSGEKGTLVEGCQLQDIAHTKCGAVLGIQCLSTPLNHVLDEKQILLRLTAVLPRIAGGNSEVNLVVKRYLKLREASRATTDKPANGSPHVSDSCTQQTPGTANGFYTASSAPGAAELSLLHAELEAQRSDIERIDSAGFKVVTGLDDAVSRVEGDLGKMRDTLCELRHELRGNHEDMASLKTEIKDVKKQSHGGTAISRLEDQLKSVNEAMETIRSELNDLAAQFQRELDSVKAGLRHNKKDIDDLKSHIKDRVTVRDHAKDMAAVRGELSQLRKQIDEGRAKPPEHFPSRELDILASNIAKIGNRASQVESLQMEFEIFKGRVERMETPSQVRQAPVPNAENFSAYDRYNDHDYHGEDLRSSRRKRPSSGLDTSLLSGSGSSKRAATSSDPVDSIDESPSWPGNAPSSPVLRPADTKARTDTILQTKTGKVNKRTQRPARRSHRNNREDKLAHSKERG